MSDLEPGKKIVLTRHFFQRWVEKINASMKLEDLKARSLLMEKIRERLKTKKYCLVFDDKEKGFQKYRMICRIDEETITFLVLDARKLVFKSVWPAKKWEKEYFKEVRKK